MENPTDKRKVSWKLWLGLCILFFSLALIGTATYYYFLPKQKNLYGSNLFIGTYHGFGLGNSPGFLGMNFVSVRMKYDDGSWTDVEIDGDGYSPFKSFYANGNLRGEGVCMVEVSGNRSEPYVNSDDVLNGKFYGPNGKLVAQVKNGTGRILHCYADGSTLSRIDLKNGKHMSFIWYWPTGAAHTYATCDSAGETHGVYLSDYEDGTPLIRGIYEHGKKVGRWFYFHSDSSVELIKDHSTDPPTTTEFALGKKSLDAETMKQFEIKGKSL